MLHGAGHDARATAKDREAMMVGVASAGRGRVVRLRFAAGFRRTKKAYLEWSVRGSAAKRCGNNRLRPVRCLA